MTPFPRRSFLGSLLSLALVPFTRSRSRKPPLGMHKPFGNLRLPADPPKTVRVRVPVFHLTFRANLTAGEAGDLGILLVQARGRVSDRPFWHQPAGSVRLEDCQWSGPGPLLKDGQFDREAPAHMTVWMTVRKPEWQRTLGPGVKWSPIAVNPDHRPYGETDLSRFESSPWQCEIQCGSEEHVVPA